MFFSTAGLNDAGATCTPQTSMLLHNVGAGMTQRFEMSMIVRARFDDADVPPSGLSCLMTTDRSP